MAMITVLTPEIDTIQPEAKKHEALTIQYGLTSESPISPTSSDNTLNMATDSHLDLNEFLRTRTPTVGTILYRSKIKLFPLNSVSFFNKRLSSWGGDKFTTQ